MADPIFLPLEYFANNRSQESNTIDRYLNDKIDFAGRSIAVSYLHFYDSFQNVSERNGNNKLKYKYGDNIYEVMFQDGTYTYKDYDNFLHFAMKRNGHVKVVEGIEQYGISILVNTVYNALSVRIWNGYTLLIESHKVAEFLGINIGEYSKDFNGQNIPNITMSNDTMFVHCNIVDNSLIPEFSDVVFTCPMNRQFGVHVNFIPNEKRYLKCTNACTQNIKIWLTNQCGVPLNMAELKWGIGIDIK